MPPSRSRGGDPAPAAVERTAGCRSGGSLSTPAAHPPHGGDPKTAPAVGAVRDASTGTGVDIRERRLHKDGTPVKVSRPTAPDGFDEASAAPGQYHRLSSLPRHPSLQMRGQMGSGQSPAFCLPVVNGLVASDPAGGASGGSTGRDAYHHGKTPGALLLLLVPTGKLPAKASVARSWSRLPPSMVRACFFTWVLFLLCAGGSCKPILKNEFLMEFCPLNTSETCSVPLSHPFKRPIPIHRTWLTEQILETPSVRRMLDEDRKHKCNNSQSLVFRIVSTVAPIISFFANIAPSLNVYEIGQVEERRKILLASSSTFISASSFSWSWYQYKQECLDGLKMTILILSGLVHLAYALLFWIHSDVNSILSFFILLVGLSVSATGIWNKLTLSILGLSCMAIGHILRVAGIRRYRTANMILAGLGLAGIFPLFCSQSWEAEVLFTISTLISSGSRLIDLCMQCYFHRAPEDEDAPHDPPLDLVNPEDDVQDSNQLAALHAAHVPPLGQVVPEDIVQDSNQIPVPLGGAPIVAPNVAGELGDDEAPHDVVIVEGGVSHNCPAGTLGVQDIAQEDSNGGALEVVANAQVAVIQSAPAPADVLIAEGGVSHNCPAGALGVQVIDQEDGNGGAPEMVANAQVAVIHSAPAPAGAPGVEVAATAVADAE